MWFLEHLTFQEWKANEHDDLLWLSADPGCGKSVLSRALVDEKLVGVESSSICHFFFKDNEEQNNVATAMCALLHQFFCAHESLIQRHVASAVKKSGHNLKNDFEELWQIWISAATDPSAGNVICILDALDECKQSDRDKLIRMLENFYRSSLGKSKTGSRLKFLVTSRPYDYIERQFRKLTNQIPTIRLAGEKESELISREIGVVIKAKVEDIAEELNLSEEVKLSLHKRLSEVPNRTYLWLHLIFDQLKEALGRTKKKLLNVIDKLPKTVEQAYEEMLVRCTEEEEARRVLQIIVAAKRPLTLCEIDVALEIRPNLTSYAELDLEGDANREQWIRKSCGLFVSIVDSRIYLIHQTAKEFLIRQKDEQYGPKGWRHSVDLQQSHRMLSEICITHLLLLRAYVTPYDGDGSIRRWHSQVIQVAEDDPKKHASFAFLDYSAKHWVTHVQQASISDIDWLEKASKLCESGNGFGPYWVSINWRSYYLRDVNQGIVYRPQNQSALYWAAFFGLKEVVQCLLDFGMDADVRGRYLGNALQAAAYGGYGKVMGQLLNAGADINAQYGCSTALEIACYRGHVSVVDLLLYVYQIT